MERPFTRTGNTYVNPVYGRSFPDPFVIRHGNVYYAICTGHADDGRVFGMLRSHDLVNWQRLPGAMEPLAHEHPHYWAPEITYHNGRFYLYYSVGNETFMEIRVAVSDRPEGGYVDSGRRLTYQDFAIDAHVFIDDDRQWYMFYATDFLEHDLIGTGTVVDRMLDPFTLAGEPRPVTRAKYDWQVYDPQRKEKGGVRWHTVEGPFVLKRKGVYYEVFSGGNWQNVSYGVSFAVTDNLNQDDEWIQFCDGENTLPILRTIPGKVLGPGHNSIIRGPNGLELYCVYHVWVGDARVLAIDRMDTAGGSRLFVAGATTTPQPAPFQPHYSASEPARRLELSAPHAVSEFGFKLRSSASTRVFALESDGSNEIYAWNIDPTELKVLISRGNEVVAHSLAPDTDPSAHHLVRVELDGKFVRVTVDQVELIDIARLNTTATSLVLGEDVEFNGLFITYGFEELFETPDLASRGWRLDGSITVETGVLRLEAIAGAASISRSVKDGDCDIAVNVRFTDIDNDDARVSIGIGSEVHIFARRREVTVGGTTLSLPRNYDEGAFYQFQVRRFGAECHVLVDGMPLGVADACHGGDLSITANHLTAELDMVRYTEVPNQSEGDLLAS